MTSGWLRRVLDAVRMRLTGASKTTHEAREREKMAALEEAERQLASLNERSETAMAALNARDKRNHWRESIQDMINGVA